MHDLLRALTSGAAKKRTAPIVCVVLALGHLLGFVHEGVVSHAVCAEHGEAIHAGHGSSPSTTSAGAADVALVSESAEASAAHAHEHCACPSHRRERFALAPAVVTVHGLPRTNVAPPHQGQTALGGGIRTIVIAPKGSPPV